METRNTKPAIEAQMTLNTGRLTPKEFSRLVGEVFPSETVITDVALWGRPPRLFSERRG